MAMDNATFHFKIGRFKCMVVSDGTTTDEGEPPARPKLVHGLNCLLIDTGEHRVLVDTGCGNRFQSTAGKLLGNLSAEGVKPGDIDRIIFTHGHFDHVCGSIDAKGRPVFTNARYIASVREWQSWATPEERTELQRVFLAAARKYLLSVPERFDLVKDGDEALPGIRFIIVPGHTPGLVMLEITSDEEKLIGIGDIIHNQIEFSRPDYYAMFDVAPEQAVRTREQVFSRVARSGALLFSCHLPFPGLGHIVTKGRAFDWRPIAADECPE
jgi:glyoxylase-like metal-dependent hydrolase (beta-lactamase superfamily II)